MERFLKDGGYLAVTQLCWLKDNPPDAARAFWAEAYPAMGTIGLCVQQIEQAGLSLAGHFILPESAWWDDYYDCIEAKLKRYRLADPSPEAAATLEEMQREMDIYRSYSEYYGYVFFVMKKA